MKLVIDRKRWLRGEGGASSKLLRPDDEKMCCLGFLALQCGADARQIRNVALPNGHPFWPEWMRGWQNKDDDVGQLMDLNDAKGIAESERERGLAAIFAKHGVEVEFVDGN